MSNELPDPIGRRYLKETRYTRKGLGELSRSYPRGNPFKEYPEVAVRIPIRPTKEPPAADLWKTLAQRRSLRQYQTRYLGREELAALVWATQGVTAASQNYLLRTAPSAGALYPVETYLAIHRVEEMEPGIWHLNLPDFSLELLTEMDTRQTLVHACLGQRFVGEASVAFIWTGILNRAMWKYRERAIRYIFLDAGHICQNLMLAATALGLGCCPVGAFFDEEVESLVGADGIEEAALYLAAVGPLSD
jgi:SagB-type dehydrogenase family enzyme|uniref:SagB/ThcOx family dehydrogenase n=1 Tax=Desulfobacca acetoxidans TaxID=60893 RepID=A0A7V6A5C1_9BACT